MSFSELLIGLVFIAAIVARPFGAYTAPKRLPGYIDDSPFAMLPNPGTMRRRAGTTLATGISIKAPLKPPAAFTNRPEPSRTVMPAASSAPQVSTMSMQGNASQNMKAKAQFNLVKIAKEKAKKKKKLLFKKKKIPQ